MNEFFLIKNWKRYQHYKDRNPPWIKLHFEMLSSEDWAMLPDASKALMIACMLIASRNEGRVPNKPAYIQRVAYMEHCDFQPLLQSGFLIDASESKRLIAEFRPETEVETEKETEKEKRVRFAPPSVDEVGEYCQSRKNGIDPQAFVDFYSSKGWRIGTAPMKDWQAAVRTWEKRNPPAGDRKHRCAMSGCNNEKVHPYRDGKVYYCLAHLPG